MTPGGQVADPTFFDALYTYAWFVTFALSFVLYLLLMRRPAPAHDRPRARRRQSRTTHREREPGQRLRAS